MEEVYPNELLADLRVVGNLELRTGGEPASGLSEPSAVSRRQTQHLPLQSVIVPQRQDASLRI